MNNNITAPQVRFGDWISEGWKMFTEQWKGWVTVGLGFFLAVVVPIGAFVVVMYGMIFATTISAGPRGAPPEVPMMTIALMYLGIFGLIIVLLPLSVLLIGGAYRAAFKQLRGGTVEFRDLLSAKDCYWRLLGATIIHGFLVMVGSMLCVIPAFIVSGLLYFTMPLIVERNLGVFEAMRLSRDTTQPNLLMFTLFAFVAQLIASAGTYACYVGLLATWPLMFTIGAVAYRDCFGVSGARSFLPSPPQQQAGYEAPPQQSGYQAPPPPGGYQAPPQQSGYQAPSQQGGYQTPPQQSGYQAPPQQAGYEASPPAFSAPAPAPVEQTPVCASCQTPLPATAQFCPRCGAINPR